MSDLFLEMGYPGKSCSEQYSNTVKMMKKPYSILFSHTALKNLTDDLNVIHDVHIKFTRANHVDVSNVSSVREYEAMKSLENMGFPFDEKFRAIERCGIDTQIEVLVDSIHVAKTEKEDDIQGLNCVGLKRK